MAFLGHGHEEVDQLLDQFPLGIKIDGLQGLQLVNNNDRPDPSGIEILEFSFHHIKGIQLPIFDLLLGLYGELKNPQVVLPSLGGILFLRVFDLEKTL